MVKLFDPIPGAMEANVCDAAYWLRPQTPWAAQLCGAMGRAYELAALCESYARSPDASLNKAVVRRGRELEVEARWLAEHQPAVVDEHCHYVLTGIREAIANSIDCVAEWTTRMRSAAEQLIDALEHHAWSEAQPSRGELKALLKGCICELREINQTWEAQPIRGQAQLADHMQELQVLAARAEAVIAA